MALGARDARAQARVITGTVTSSQTGQGVSGATVSVLGTVVVAVTDDKGAYSLAGPQGDVNLLVRGIGYKRRQVAVTADQGSADVALDQDIFNLEAVVVTGQATSVEQKNLANAVATVAPEQLNRAPTPTIESALQGKIPGALIQMNSGAPGGGGQINLRGVTTINGGVDPLIVVDGMVISNDAISSNMNAVTAASSGGNASTQDNAVNRIADLNPADIERVEVLKGASAAAIYGSQASNGVIIITTRRGQTGRPKFSMTQRFGEYRLSNTLGLRSYADSAAAVAALGAGHAALIGQLCAGGCPDLDLERELFGQHPLSFETDGSVSGGNGQTSYFISGLTKKDGGIAPNTGYEKQSVRANIDQLLGSRFHLSVNTNVVHSTANRGISNNDNTGTSPYFVLSGTPSFFDLRQVNGVFPVNPFQPSNPLQTEDLLKSAEDLWRVIGSGNLKIDAFESGPHHVQFTLGGGLDFFTQRNDILSPPTLQFEPQDGQPGTVVLGKASDLRLNLLGSVVHTYTPSSGKFSATTSAGFQYQDQNQNITSTLGRSILAGEQNVSEATSINVTQRLNPIRGIGLYGQEEVLALDQRLLLTLGVRGDRSSVNGDTKKYYIFPKGAASYRFVAPFSGVDELKIRAALGQSGNPPLFGAKFSPDTTGTISGLFGTFAGTRAGAANIKPERQTEIEAGFDATLGHEFATLSFTFYNKTITDLLLQQTLAPSTGLATAIFNGGKLRNRGEEISLALSPIRHPDFNWLFRTTFFRNRATVVELPVPAFLTGGFGVSLGAFQIEQGKSATQIIGTEGVVGDATPDFQMSFSNDLTFKRLSLGFLWDWKKGGDIINLTQLLFDAGGNSIDQVAAGNARITAWGGGLTKTYVQDGSYLKLREVSLSYELPPSVVNHLFGGIRNARLNLSGRNLITISPYPGLDPEVSNFGNQAIARNIDVAPFPPSRSFFFSIDLGF
jgi:TonB-linked SusC/RagA family outer membrane protein